MRIQTLSIMAVMLFLFTDVYGGVITDPAFFGEDTRLINFDEFLDNTDLTDQIEGVVFSSESQDHIGFADNTDPADTGNRFDAPFKVLSEVAGGGAPVSSPRYAAGVVFLSPWIDVDETMWEPASDMRLDFDSPQSTVGFWVIDSDFYDARLRFFDSSGNLLETLIVPEQAEGGAVFRGVSLLSPTISYLIIDGSDSGPLGSTFIDDLYFIPEPTMLGLMILGGAVLLRRKTM